MILTIYYDDHCPLCLLEMKQLKKFDKNKDIDFVPLHDDSFSKNHPHINKTEAIKILHAQLNTGEILLGLDANCKAWNIVGKHRWLVILRWPIIRIFTDIIYRIFARYRSQISKLLTEKKSCSSCQIK